MTNGAFITFEGIDGAGKSSHIDALAQAGRALQQPRVAALGQQRLALRGDPGGDRTHGVCASQPRAATTARSCAATCSRGCDESMRAKRCGAPAARSA